MLAIHDQFSYEMRNRLGTIEMGLGLVRLLQDAGRVEEARSTLSLLENGGKALPRNRLSDLQPPRMVLPQMERESGRLLQ